MDLYPKKTNAREHIEFCDLRAIRYGSRILKVSTYGDQVLVLCVDSNSNIIMFKMCYNEDVAFELLEELMK
jgi:hypothetical protein